MNRILIEDSKLEDEIAEMFGAIKPRGKDVAPHHITTEGATLGDILDRAKQPQEPIADLLARADASMVGDHSRSYLRDVGVQNDDLASQLRHRAHLMRLRADEFDRMADIFETTNLEYIRSAVENYSEQVSEIESLLRSHAHVNPTAVRN